ncbi:PREDICTED: uncharacterized protein LOC101313000 [Fragaria vesca subsp. vesca]|uniref:uncharacterized protein LOC101313000 n=1 Tax=Fragaria vesca subsp. vesca TaxID=101020 RepID=UPI0002C2FDA1|nr:PREDICTED: uncharacterized protein LOC101313000 [Fragaria vesca subsp. vesca]
MCPNPDWHPTFQCPNLTPELKEWLKEARLKGGTFRAFHPDDRYCHVCLSKDHWSSACPYQIELPVGATIGPFAEILCLCCGEDRPHPGVPGVDWKARVVLKDSCMLGSPEALRRAAAARGIKANTSAAASGTVLKASASKATTAGTATSTSTSDEYLVSSTSLSA